MAKNRNIGSFTDLYQHVANGNRLFSALLPGHLAIEFLLRKLIFQYDPNLTKLADELNHARLINLNFEIGNISKDQKDVLISINSLRNKLAHQLTFTPKIEELKLLWAAAAKAFSDLTDGIDQGLNALSRAKIVDDLEDWEISELFIQICYDLHSVYTDRGGEYDEF